MWFYISLGYLGFVLVSIFVPVIPNILFNGAAIGILLGWYFSLGKKQIRYVQETWQGRYQRKPWAKPLLVGFGCTLGYLSACAVLGIIASLLFGIK